MSFLLLRARRKIVPLLPLGVLGGLGAKREEKIEFVMEFEIQFFSVAERPLTFFAYFLNAKKVGRRRLVIVPATAGGLPLFPHAASVPAPALAPVRSHFTCGETARPVIGPAFWVCRAKAGAAFRCAKPPWPMFWPVLFIGQKMRYSVLAGFSSISQCR